MDQWQSAESRLAAENRRCVLFSTGRTSPGKPEVTGESPEAIVRPGAGLTAHDPQCESDREPHGPIAPGNNRQHRKGYVSPYFVPSPLLNSYLDFSAEGGINWHQEVNKRAELATIEAMKIENAIIAPFSARIEEICVTLNYTVKKGQLMFVLAEE